MLGVLTGGGIICATANCGICCWRDLTSSTGSTWRSAVRAVGGCSGLTSALSGSPAPELLQPPPPECTGKNETGCGECEPAAVMSTIWSGSEAGTGAGIALFTGSDRDVMTLAGAVLRGMKKSLWRGYDQRGEGMIITRTCIAQ